MLWNACSAGGLWLLAALCLCLCACASRIVHLWERLRLAQCTFRLLWLAASGYCVTLTWKGANDTCKRDLDAYSNWTQDKVIKIIIMIIIIILLLTSNQGVSLDNFELILFLLPPSTKCGMASVHFTRVILNVMMLHRCNKPIIIILIIEIHIIFFYRNVYCFITLQVQSIQGIIGWCSSGW